MSANRRMMWARIETSSAGAGSSSTTSRALVDKGRAIASRWRCSSLKLVQE